MNTPRDPHPDPASDALSLLAQLQTNGLDDLTPEQVEELAAAVDRDAALSDQLGSQSIASFGPIATEPMAMPSENAWDDVFAAATAPAPVRMHRGRASAIAGMLAACIALSFVWTGMKPKTIDAWPLMLATNVEVLELEVYNDDSSFVSYLPDGSGAVIWVIEGES